MKVEYPDWAIENLAGNGTFQCGCCFMCQCITGEGEVPNVKLGFRHVHHEDCTFSHLSGDFEFLKVDLGDVAFAMLHPDQPRVIPPSFGDKRNA
jgi:hypothetical protein